MSSDLPTSNQTIPEPNSPLFLAMQGVAAARNADDAIKVLREHVVPDADRVSLIRIRHETGGKVITQILGVWDKDGIALDAGFPVDVNVLVDEQPLVVMDTSHLDEFLSPLKAYAVDLLKAVSVGIFPLSRGREIVGQLIVLSRSAPFRDDTEVRALIMLSWQLATVLDAFALQEALDEQVNRMNAVSALARNVATAADIDEIGTQVTEQLIKVIPIKHISLTRVQSDDGSREMLLWHGSAVQDQATFEQTFVLQSIQSGESLFVDGLQTKTDGSGIVPADVGKIAILPIKFQDAVLGTLNVGLERSTPYTPRDRHLLEDMAAQLGAALADRERIKHLQETLEETTALYSTSLALTAAQSIDEIYATALSEMAHLSGADRITLYLAGPDPRGDVSYVELTAVWKGDRVMPRSSQMRYPLAEAPVLAQFPQSRSNLIFNDVTSDMRLDDKLRAYYKEEDVNALMLIPFSTGAIWLGAAMLEAQQGQSFSNDQARLCRSLADQAALSLDSQILLKRTQLASAREHMLVEIINRIRQATSVAEVEKIAREELSKAVNVPIEKIHGVSISDSMKIRVSRDDLEFIRSVETQMALAVENLRLLEATQEAVSREQGMRTIASALNKTLELDEILKLTLENVAAIISHDAANIQLVKQGLAQIAVSKGYYERGVDEEDLKNLYFPIQTTNTLKTMSETKEPFLISDVSTYSEWVSNEATGWVRSFLGAPIYVEDEVIGFINLDSAKPNFFTEAVAEQLQGYANQIALPIRNARLYQTTRRQSELISQVSSELQRSTAVDDVIESAVRSLNTAFPDYDIRLRLKTSQTPDQADSKPAG